MYGSMVPRRTVTVIEINNLRVDRNGRCICSVPRFSVSQGEHVGIVGRNGTGKTTLLRVMAGLENSYDGKCKVHTAPQQRAYVDQSPYLFRGNVLFNGMYGLRARGYSRKHAQAKAMRWIEKLGIGALAAAQVNLLSGGERRRAALARALAIEPELLLLDEPLAEMDDQGLATIESIFAELSDTTIVLTSPVQLSTSLSARTYPFGPEEERVGV